MASKFQTARLDFVDDIAYKVPFQDIIGVIDKKDSQIDDAIIKAEEIEAKMGEIENLDVDDEFKRQKLSEYQTQIDDIVDSITTGNNRFNSGKIYTNMNKVKRDITKDFTQGDIYNITKGYKNMNKAFESVDNSQNTYGQDKDLTKEYFKHLYRKAGGAEKGAFKVVEDGNITPLDSTKMDFVTQSSWMEGLRSRVSAGTSLGDDGKYLYTTNTKTEEWSDKDISSVAEKRFDYEMKSEFDRRHKMMGEMKGLSGKELENYVAQETETSKEKFKKHALDMFARKNVVSQTDRRESGIYMENLRQQHALRRMRYGHQLEKDSQTYGPTHAQSPAQYESQETFYYGNNKMDFGDFEQALVTAIPLKNGETLEEYNNRLATTNRSRGLDYAKIQKSFKENYDIDISIDDIKKGLRQKQNITSVHSGSKLDADIKNSTITGRVMVTRGTAPARIFDIPENSSAYSSIGEISNNELRKYLGISNTDKGVFVARTVDGITSYERLDASNLDQYLATAGVSKEITAATGEKAVAVTIDVYVGEEGEDENGEMTIKNVSKPTITFTTQGSYVEKEF